MRIGSFSVAVGENLKEPMAMSAKRQHKISVNYIFSQMHNDKPSLLLILPSAVGKYKSIRIFPNYPVFAHPRPFLKSADI